MQRVHVRGTDYQQALAFNLSTNHDQEPMSLSAPPNRDDPGLQDPKRMLRSM